MTKMFCLPTTEDTLASHEPATHQTPTHKQAHQPSTHSIYPFFYLTIIYTAMNEVTVRVETLDVITGFLKEAHKNNMSLEKAIELLAVVKESWTQGMPE